MDAQRRLVWLDRLRILAVLLLFPFHSARVFDGFEMFYAKSDVTSQLLSWAVVGYLSIWQMPLLFVLAGMSSSFALRRRSGRAFLGERAKRLLVPFLFGCLVLVPPQGWYGARTNAGYTGTLPQYFVDYFTGRFGFISDYLGGPNFGQLWFILYLFVLSAIALPLFLRLRRDGGSSAARMSRSLSRPAWWLLPPLLLMIMSGLPELGGHNLFVYLVWFVLGYVLVAADEPLQAAERLRMATLAGGTALAVALIASWGWKEALPDPSFGRAIHEYGMGLSALLLVLAALGFARRHLDAPSARLAYLSEASYPTYVLHQTVIVALAFPLVQVLPQPLVAWALLTIASAAVTYVVYELTVRRWTLTRVLFGMKPLPVPAEQPPFQEQKSA